MKFMSVGGMTGPLTMFPLISLNKKFLANERMKLLIYLKIKQKKGNLCHSIFIFNF